MKNSAIMKIAVMTLAMCPERFGCPEWENMRNDQSAIGKVSRTDLPTLRGTICWGWGIRASVAIYLSPEQHGQSQIGVIEGNEHHRHPCDGGHGFVARYATQAHKGHKPDGSSDKKHRKKEQGRSDATQLSRPHTGGHKRRAETQTSQEAQRCRTRHAAFSCHANAHQF